jgi:hypothetical protein
MAEQPLSDRLGVICDATRALYDACAPVRNIAGSLAGTLNDIDRAMAGTYIRMSLWIESFLCLPDKRHFQALLHGARCLYELWVDLAELRNDPSLAGKYHAFAVVAKFAAAEKEIRCRDKFGAKDTVSVAAQRRFLSQNRARYNSLLKQHWPSAKNGSAPLNWNGDLRARTASLGRDEELEYRSLYSLLCWYSHAGLTGISDMPIEGFDDAVGFAHAHAQKFYRLATDIVAIHFRIYEASTAVEGQVKSWASRLSDKTISSIIKTEV